jgi:hypothetical protein
MNCLVCNRDAETHHILSRKAYPEYIDAEWNHVRLCRSHHQLIHSKGLYWFATKFNLIENILDRGFFFDGRKFRKHKD